MLLFELTKEELMNLDKELLVRMLLTQNAYVAGQQQAIEEGLSKTADALMQLVAGLQMSRAPFVETYGGLLEEINAKVLAAASALN